MTTPDISPVIRRAASDDASTLAALAAATFTETFGHLYPPEDLQTFLRTHSIEAWTQVLTDARTAVYVADLGDRMLAGFIVVGDCKLPVANREATAGEVKQLYVVSQHQNLRLGTRLIEQGLAWLESQQRSPIYIGVWSENYGAQRFYERYGFSKVGEYGFHVGSTVDREFILKR